MMERYIVSDETGHPCCMNASVVNTAEVVGKHPDGNDMYATVCECHDEETASMICDALNAQEPRT